MAAAGLGTAAHAGEAPLAVFDFELVDTSLEGETYGEDAAQTARLRLISAQLREGLAASGQYRVVDAARTAEAVAGVRASNRYLHRCNDCELDAAQALGAELALVGWVQKVSNLILNLNVVIKDVETGEPVKATSVDIRSNTDRSWERGTRQVLARILDDSL